MTLKELEQLKEKGLIRGWVDDRKSPNNSKVRKSGTSKRKGEKIKDWITLNLQHWCEVNKLELRHAGSEKGEYMFDPERMWRFDWSVPSKKIAWEYEGLNSDKSRHTTKTGYTNDSEKYNEAAAQGWRVIRYTALNYKNLINDLNRLL